MPVNEVTASRQEYALALSSAGINVEAVIPERISPPVVILAPGSPYMEATSVDGEWIMRFNLTAVVKPGTNSLMQENLEQLLEDIVNANPSYSRIQSIGQPYSMEANNALFLAADVAVDLRITI